MWGDAEIVKTWKELGFHLVPLSLTEIMISLQSGMIDAIMMNPMIVASYQWFGIARHMCEMKIAPFIGGLVISKRAWNKVSNDLKPKLMQVIKRIGKDMQKDALNVDRKALIVMKKYGLKVHPVPENIKKEWKITFDEGLEELIVNNIHKESYEKVKKYISEYRKKNTK